jgi:hypothetical protein
MRGAGVILDSPTVELLVKSLWQEGKLWEVALVEERCEEMMAACGRGRLSGTTPGHVWTVSAADLNKVYGIYSGCFRKHDATEDRAME